MTSLDDQIEPIGGSRLSRDAWAYEAILLCFLLLAPAFVLGFRSSGLSTFSIELHTYWLTKHSPFSFFLIAPLTAIAMTANLLILPDRPIIPRPILAICTAIATLAIVHEIRVRLEPPDVGLVSTMIIARYNYIGLFFSAIAASRNLRKPTLESAFAFHAFFVAWFFTVAFPWPRHVWDLPQ